MNTNRTDRFESIGVHSWLENSSPNCANFNLSSTGWRIRNHNPMFEDSLPSGSFDRKKLRVQQRGQNSECVTSVAIGSGTRRQRVDQFQQAGRRDGRCGTLIWQDRTGFFPVVRGNSTRRCAFDVKVGTLYRGLKKAPVFCVTVSVRETVQRPGLTPRPARVVPPALMCGLPDIFSALSIKKAFVRLA